MLISIGWNVEINNINRIEHFKTNSKRIKNRTTIEMKKMETDCLFAKIQFDSFFFLYFFPLFHSFGLILIYPVTSAEYSLMNI